MERAVKKRHGRLALWITLVLVLILAVAAGIYLSDYYRASGEALEVLRNPAQGITVKEIPNRQIAFIPEDPTAGLIFYPGGKVQYEAYAPLMEACAQRGILCVLLHMPCNLAVLDPDAADGVAGQFPQAERWYIGGHSLGGVMASSYVAKHGGNFAGLVLLASYSTEDLSGSELDVLTVVGTEDGVLDREKYEAALPNLPVGFTEVELEGGNHAQFGSYGPQEGDGEPTISSQEQIDLTADAIAELIEPEK